MRQSRVVPVISSQRSSPDQITASSNSNENSNRHISQMNNSVGSSRPPPPKMRWNVDSESDEDAESEEQQNRQEQQQQPQMKREPQGEEGQQNNQRLEELRKQRIQQVSRDLANSLCGLDIGAKLGETTNIPQTFPAVPVQYLAKKARSFTKMAHLPPAIHSPLYVPPEQQPFAVFEDIDDEDIVRERYCLRGINQQWVDYERWLRDAYANKAANIKEEEAEWAEPMASGRQQKKN